VERCGFEEFAKYTYPRREAEACEMSLLWATKDVQFVEESGKLRLGQTQLLIELEQCGALPDPESWVEGDRMPTPDEVRMIIQETSKDSNAGYPYCLEGMPKQEYLLEHVDEVYQKLCARLCLLAAAADDLWAADPLEAARCGYADPYYVVEKWEPLKKEKLLRQRNIICGSALDELVDRLLYRSIAKALKRTWGQSWSMIGLGMNRQKRLRVLAALREVMHASMVGGVDLVDSDQQGFEYRHQGHDYRLNAELVATVGSFGVLWGRIARGRAAVAARGVLVFSNGDVWVQEVLGLNKSGRYPTSIDNTAKRARDAYATGALKVKAAGDDAVEARKGDPTEDYESLGAKIKQFRISSDGKVDFCSNEWDLFLGGEPVPSSAVKSFFKLCSEGPTLTKVAQVMSAFWIAPERPRFVLAFGKAGFPMLKDEGAC